MEALLIVDMQNACIAEVARHDLPRVISAINNLSRSFRASGFPVIHVQHEEEAGAFAKGSEGWKIASEIDVSDSDIMVAKSYCDAFIKTKLQSLLQKYNANRLTVTGCATDFCVDSTIKGAIAHGYDLVVPSDGHTTSDRPHVGARELIAHFNWNWPSLITGKQKVSVVSSFEVMSLINSS